MSKTSTKFKDFEFIVINNNQFDKCLKIYLPIDKVNIISLLCYLKTNGWNNYKFNEYSIKTQIDDQGTMSIVTLNYIPPTLNFK